MPDLWVDVDTAVVVPVNVLPLLDDTDFKSIETAVVYNSGGLALTWNFVTTAGAVSGTAVTPTTSGNYDWSEPIADKGMYAIEIPASGGASINNDTEGVGWFTGVATGVLPWRGPTIGFRKASMNNVMIDNGSLQDNLEDMYDGTGYVGGTIKLGVSLVAIMASALTGTAAQISAAFVKFFDKASPTGTVNSLPDAVPGTSGGIPTTNGTKLSQTVDLTAGQTIAANLTQILGTALTETAGYLAAGFKKFFNIATPTGTLNSLPDAVPGASGGLPTTNGTKMQQTVDLTSGQTIAANATQVLGTALTETSSGYLAAGIKKLFDVATPVFTAASVNQTGDSFARIGAAGAGLTAVGDIRLANLDAPISTVDTVVDGIATTLGSAGAGLTSVPNSAGVTTLLSRVPDTLSLANVNSEVDAALADIHLDHLLATDYDPASKPGSATALLNEIVGSDAGVSQFTANALELSPTGGSAPTVTQIRQEMDSNSTKLALLTGNVALDATVAKSATALSNAVWTDAKANHLDAAISTRSTFAGGAVASVTAPVVAGTVTDKAGYQLTAAYDLAKSAAQAGDAMTLTVGERSSSADAILARALSAESYAADGATPTLSQMLWMLWSTIGDFSVSGMTLTTYKQNGTVAMTFTLDSATAPTSRTRAT